MSSIDSPKNLDELQRSIESAVKAQEPLELIGQGSKRNWGRPLQTARTLDLSAFNGIINYQPEELVLTASAATPMAEIEEAIAEKNQQLAFEPPVIDALWNGEASGGGSLGGALACNLAGPRRIKAGAARDHFLGFTAVSGRGEIFKAGGKVIKNVSGYDLMKLMTGSFGTLAAMTEVTVKVLPRPEKTYTVLVYGLSLEQGGAAMRQALASSHEVSAAAHLPYQIAAQSAVGHVKNAGVAVTALRLEGPGPSVLHRTQALRRLLADFGETEELHSHNSLAFWRECGSIGALRAPEDRLIWRISVPPRSGPSLAQAMIDLDRQTNCILDWGGGLVWLALDSANAGEDGGAALLRQKIAKSGGHATLLRGPRDLRASVPVFQPQPSALAALSQRIKSSFDPLGLLNPGRMVEGL